MESGVTYRLYYLFSIPKGEEEASMHLLAQRGETVLTTDFTMRSVIEDAPQLQLGDSLLSTDGYNVCVTDLFVTKKLEPSAPAGTYTYYIPEEEGEKLLVLRTDVPELSGEESEMNLVMGATLMDAQYGSTPGQIVVEAFDGSNLAGFSTYYPISCNGTLYYLFDVTDEMLEDGAYLLLYAHDVYYVLGLDGVSER